MATEPLPSPSSEEQVVLVDLDDQELGVAPKLRVHREGRLHRAVSVLVVDWRGRLLLQRRARGKYHSAGQWANTCCTHPRPHEAPADAAQRRLREEMGISCALEHVGTFVYRAPVGSGLVEHELDHLFVGRFDGVPRPDPAEVEEWRWEHLEEVERDLAARPDAYVVWLRPVLAALSRAGIAIR